MHDELLKYNNQRARMFGVHPDDWYLGSQIEYKWRKSYDTSHCVFYGSPDVEIAEKFALFNIWEWSMEEHGYKMYCDIIWQYYDLDNFEIPSDDKAIYAYLDRAYNLVHLDTDIDVESTFLIVIHLLFHFHLIMILS